ncbi:MAG: pilus assembly protein [Deltaproteobacteria bacterium]|nr:pilus assembly protein [Deltaproteobacteria bacterium]
MIYLQNNRGVAAVELAICLPILILLVCGSIEFGILFYNEQVITNASREGARAGIVEGTVNDDIEDIIENYCNGKLINLMNGSSELEAVTISKEGVDPNPIDLTVRVSYKYNFLLAGILGFTDKTLSAQTVMRME